MKLIAFFSRFALICNACFVLFVIFNRIEANKAVSGGKDTVGMLPYFKELVIILGFSAIVINLLICLAYGVVVLAKKSFLLPKWLVITNLAFLFIQFYFFFFQ